MAVKPIPKRLLPHEISVEEFTGGGRYGDEWSPPSIFSRVRIEPSSKVTVNGSGEDTVAQSILFIDAKNSKPAKGLTVKSRVTFNGEVMTVNKVDPHYADSNKVHHWECELI